MSVPLFGPDDKVFAKVRGYPPWPAKIRGVADETPHTVRYHVYFYGTKETAICKAEELFDYYEFKSQYAKPLKRKHFMEALTEIESDLPEYNLDFGGYSDEPDSDDEGNLVIDESPPEHVIDACAGDNDNGDGTDGDTKDNGDSADGDNNDNDTDGDNNDNDTDGDNNDNDGVADDDNEECNVDEDGDNNDNGDGADGDNEEFDVDEHGDNNDNGDGMDGDNKKCDVDDNKDNIEENENDANIHNNVTNVNNENVDQEQPYNSAPVLSPVAMKRKKSVNKQVKTSTEVVVSRSGRKIKRTKYFYEYEHFSDKNTGTNLPKVLDEGRSPSPKRSGYSSPALSRRLQKKSKRNTEELYTQSLIKDCIPLQIEMRLLHCECRIRACLTVGEPANCDECLSVLDEINCLELTSDIVKKHRCVLGTLDRVKHYEGNVVEWNFNNEEADEFFNKTEHLRNKACEVYEKLNKFLQSSTSSTFTHSQQVCELSETISPSKVCESDDVSDPESTSESMPDTTSETGTSDTDNDTSEGSM